MKKIITILLFAACICAYSQDEQKDSVKLNTWLPSGVAGLNVSQIAFTDWAQGGDNSFTYSIFGNFGLKYIDTSWVFRNSLILTYGQSKIGTGGYKINDNDFYLESVYSRRLGWIVDPYIGNTIRTTVTTGYKYTDTSKTKIADFFDPGYVTQSIGFTYDHQKVIKTRLGLAFQETFTNTQRQYTDDPATSDKIEAFKFETGIESVTNLFIEFRKNLVYDSKLRLFTRFEAMDVWDVRWDNLITAKITDLINVNLNVIVIYQKDQSLKTQVKQALQIGIVYQLF